VGADGSGGDDPYGSMSDERFDIETKPDAGGHALSVASSHFL
jgi:hypothetical protein